MKQLTTITLALSLIFAMSAQNSIYVKRSKFIPTDSLEDYGTAVDIENEWIMIGAEDAPISNLEAGTVYVYKNENDKSQFVKKLYPSDGGFLTRYGNSISVENTTMVIGSWSKGYSSGGTFYPAAGKAYVYERDAGGNENWGEVKDLQSPVPVGSEYFGFCVDIGENIIAVGAYGNDDGASNTGKVYLYGRDVGGAGNWGFIKGIQAATAGNNYNFGRWVEVTDNYLAVTSPDVNGQGKVYIHYKDEGGLNNWGLKKVLESPSPASNRLYGDETSLEGDRILVGALRDFNTNGSNSGRSYLYMKDEGGADNWGLVKTFEPAEFSSQQEYGLSVDLNGDYIIIGAEEDDEAGPNTGAAYIYNRNQGGADNWGLVNKILDCSNTGVDDFGTAVAISADRAVVGADDHDAIGDNSGAAYLYRLSPDMLQVTNITVSNSNSLVFLSGMTLSANAQVSESGQTVKFQSQEEIELENLFSVNPMTTLECIIDNCGQ